MDKRTDLSFAARARQNELSPGGPAIPCLACDVRDMVVCGALDYSELVALQGLLTMNNLAAGQTVFHESDPADSVFNVTAGSVKLYKLLGDGRRQITGFLFPGDFMGLALHDLYAYTAEAIEPLKVCRFPRRRFEDFLAHHPHMERRLLGIASNELASIQDQILLLGRKTAKEKLTSFLLTLADRAARRGDPAEAPVRLPMGRADIADYLGLTTETVSRTFTVLKNGGGIRLVADGVQLLDRDLLEEISEGF